MRIHGYGRIFNISSSLGSLSQITDPDSGYDGAQSPAYRLSKTSLNSITALVFLVAITASIDIIFKSHNDTFIDQKIDWIDSKGGKHAIFVEANRISNIVGLTIFG